MALISKMDSPDRRCSLRHPCTGTAEILQGGKCWGWGKVSDISHGGCYIETSHPLPTCTVLLLRLTIEGIFLEISAKVVSCDTMYGMGMQFIELPAERNSLPQILEKVTDTVLSPAVQHHAESHQAPPQPQPHTQAAMRCLEQAQKELQEAMRGNEGRRAEALHLTENAIQELKNACKEAGAIATTDPVLIENGFNWSYKVH